MTKEQDLRVQQILYGYEKLLLKAIKNKRKALIVDNKITQLGFKSKEYKKWDDIENETRQQMLGFLNRYSAVFNK